MSKAYESINLRVSPEAKRYLEREVEKQRKAGRTDASQSAIVEALLLALGTPQAAQKR